MSCKYEFQGKVYTEKQLRKLLQEKGIQNQIKVMLETEEESYSPYSVDDDFDDFNQEQEQEEYFKPSYKKMNEFKYSLIDMYKNRISTLSSSIKQLYKKGEAEKAQKYEKLKNSLDQRIKELTSEIKKYNDKNPLTLTEFRYQAMVDMSRVYDLLNTGKLGNDVDLNKEIFENAEEAKRIINFYKAMELVKTNKTIDNVSIEQHPFFEPEEIYDKDGLPNVLPEEVIKILNDVADDFKFYEQQLDNTYKAIVTQVVNSNPNVQRMYEDGLTYEQIIEAKKDLPWIDAAFFDMAKGGITGDSGVLAKISMSLFTKTWDEEVSKFKAFEEKHNRLLPKVKKALRKLNNNLSLLLKKEVSFDIFFQKENDKKTGKLVQRYSSEYTNQLEIVKNLTDKKVEYAMKQENLSKREKLLFKAFEEKQNWFRENTLLFDIRKIPEIAEQFPEFAEYFIEDSKHVEELKRNISSQGYQQELNAQIEKLKEFSNWKKAYTSNFLLSYGVTSIKNLNEDQLDQLNYDIMKENPFLSVSNIYNTSPVKIKGLIVNPSFKYNTYIPRKNNVVIDYKSSFETGTYQIIETNESTNHYDENFKTIEENPDLLEYHTLISEELQNIYDSFPEDIKNKLFSNSLISTKQTIFEIFSDPNINILYKFLKATRVFWEDLKSGFGINDSSSILYDNVDVITNKLDPKVNSDFINNNQKKISDKVKIESVKFKNLNKDGKNLYSSSVREYDSMTPAALNYLATLLDLKSPIELKEKFGAIIPVGKLITNAVTSDIVQEQSINLPKIVKYYSKMAHEYSARQQMLPYMKVLKEHYEQVKRLRVKKDKILTLKGKKYTDGSVRVVANSQFQEWFDRVALGHYGDEGLLGGYEGILNAKANNEKRKNFSEKIHAIVTGKILTAEEKKAKKEINKLIEEATEKEDIEELIKIRESLGKNPALSAIFSSFLGYQRWLRLGYNLNSVTTNFLEGQTANMIIASSGEYFESKHFYRAYHIVQGSFFKSILGNRGKGMLKSAFKLRKLVNRFDILQDATNELQKASSDTTLNKFSFFGSMESTKRTEYLNQTPLMISVMLDTEITGISGKKSNVWDAIDSEGNLKPDFRKEEYIETWEKGQGQAYADFKLKVSNAILTAHGNYSELRGMMIKKNLLGKAFVFLKTWLAMQIYQRIGTERDDVETGIKGWKGRYWSHTPLTAAVQGGIAMTAAFGVGYIPIGIGVGVGAFLGARTGVKSQLGIMSELLFTFKALARKTIGIPVNILSAMTTGKQLISDPGYEKLIFQGEVKKFTERDAKNMKAVISEMSVSICWMLNILMIKSLLWDDDDEKDSSKRYMHNLLINKSMQLLESSTMYVNMIGIGEQIANNALFSYIVDFGKYIVTLDKYWKGEETATKHNEKRNKLIFPSIIKDSSFGFTKLMERQFGQTPFDYMFEDKEKSERRKIQVLRSEYKEELEQEKLPDGSPKYTKSQIQKLVNRKHKLPPDVKDTTSKTATKSVKEPVDKALRKKQSEAYKLELERIKQENKEEDEEEKTND